LFQGLTFRYFCKMKLLLLFISVFNFTVYGQSYNNLELLDNWKDDNLITNSLKNRYNECYGFVIHGKEYATIGSSEGTHFFKINNQIKLEEIDFVRGRFSNANVVHRDYKTFKNLLYAVCDEGESSLQIIDLQYLPDSVHLVADLANDFGRNHNIAIDSINELLYCFSQTIIAGGIPTNAYSMRVYTLADPLNPTLVFNGFTDFPNVHDGVIRNNMAILNCGFDGLRRYDFSIPTSPSFLQNMSIYQQQGYNHQGDLNPKGDVYIFADETPGKKLKKCRVAPDGEITIESYFGTDIQNESVPHNIMLDDRFAYVAYYNSGLRIFDYQSSPVEEVAFYDTYPDDNTNKMNGLWGVYSRLPSGRILASDRKYGLFLFDFNKDVFINRTKANFQVYPNPIEYGQDLTIFLNENYKGFLKLRLLDLSGKEVFHTSVSMQNYLVINPKIESGMYHLEISFEQNLEIVTKRKTILVF